MDDEGFSIVIGREYIYTAALPRGCAGHRYVVQEFATLVPVYQQVLIVKCLDGPDEGMTICCTPANFVTRYKAAPEKESTI